MAETPIYQIAEIDQFIEHLRAELRDISVRAASTDGNASEERLAEMLVAHEARLQAFLETRRALVAEAEAREQASR